jgi:hypothetical protein
VSRDLLRRNRARNERIDLPSAPASRGQSSEAPPTAVEPLVRLLVIGEPAVRGGSPAGRDASSSGTVEVHRVPGLPEALPRLGRRGLDAVLLALGSRPRSTRCGRSAPRIRAWPSSAPPRMTTRPCTVVRSWKGRRRSSSRPGPTPTSSGPRVTPTNTTGTWPLSLTEKPREQNPHWGAFPTLTTVDLPDSGSMREPRKRCLSRVGFVCTAPGFLDTEQAVVVIVSVLASVAQRRGTTI